MQISSHILSRCAISYYVDIPEGMYRGIEGRYIRYVRVTRYRCDLNIPVLEQELEYR